MSLNSVLLKSVLLKPVVPVGLCIGLCLGTSACGGSSEVAETNLVTTTTVATSEGTASATTQAESNNTETTLAPEGSDHQPETTVLDLQIDGTLVSINPDWVPLGRLHFVYGVEPDDRLNLRSGPGIVSEVVGSIGFASSDLTVYDEVIFVGSDRWSPIGLSDNTGGEESNGSNQGAGWVNLAFLRPTRADAPLEIRGPVDSAALDVASDAAEFVGNLSALATLIGPEGLTISSDAYVDDSEIVLSKADLKSPSEQPVLWGYEDGSGDPIERTVEEHFAQILGSTALTSTETIGVDTEIGWGNTINNLDEAFPGASVIEYHFSGTEDYANLDWASVRFVFDVSDTSTRPILLAIVQAEWTI